MEKIASFTIDHTKLKPGIYISRKDTIGSETVTTLDLRMKEPNHGVVLTPPAIHTMEHIGATFLRNHKIYKEKTIYFGPMGCLTGFYLLLKGDFQAREVVAVIQEMFSHMATFEGDIPGASPVECGNYSLMDLDQARADARTYLEETVQNIDDTRLIYPE
ncbi:MAG: S-ribosylhomocysteine lyase [Desulfobacterium sp.]|nr:S-ribosylhomocysteine lyase [Desulfobacterium sp.]